MSEAQQRVISQDENWRRKLRIHPLIFNVSLSNEFRKKEKINT